MSEWKFFADWVVGSGQEIVSQHNSHSLEVFKKDLQRLQPTPVQLSIPFHVPDHIVQPDVSDHPCHRKDG